MEGANSSAAYCSGMFFSIRPQPPWVCKSANSHPVRAKAVRLLLQGRVKNLDEKVKSFDTRFSSK